MAKNWIPIVIEHGTVKGTFEFLTSFVSPSLMEKKEFGSLLVVFELSSVYGRSLYHLPKALKKTEYLAGGCRNLNSFLSEKNFPNER